MLRILMLLLLSSRAFTCEVEKESCEFVMQTPPEVDVCRSQFSNYSSSIVSVLSNLTDIDDRSIKAKNFSSSKEAVEKSLAVLRNCERIDFPFFQGEIPDYRSVTSVLPYVILYLESAVEALDMNIYYSSSYNQRLWREEVERFVADHKS